jgi:hypothetical protein
MLRRHAADRVRHRHHRHRNDPEGTRRRKIPKLARRSDTMRDLRGQLKERG